MRYYSAKNPKRCPGRTNYPAPTRPIIIRTPPVLTYPALKCILEFIDVAKRLNITARTKSLKIIDKSVPLRLPTLQLCSDRIIIHNLGIRSVLQYRVDIFYKDQYVKGGMVNFGKIEAMRRLFKYYLGDRSNIYVDSIVFEEKVRNLLPPELNFTINKLETHYCSFGEFLPMINPNSFPLRKLSMVYPEILSNLTLDHPIVHSAGHLYLNVGTRGDQSPMSDIQKLCNKSAFIKSISMKSDDCVKIIRYWRENGKEVGTKFIFTFYLPNCIVPMIKALQEPFEEFQDKLEGLNERRFIAGLPRFAIPINNHSTVILAYTIFAMVDRKREAQIVLNVVSTTA
ncbi:hypothetical protein GCK72_008015 [Caenorhabditis remanei]|uniref:F-box associated domain-containing protein n=1 Tax=Caenorhabditis remanei TaxID=31234 RepID=A0A6A5HN79_CAERE|nr:hypothetical protein GCK72_008015 [Caenorhabditis remanei]KAF1768054.1 hypothetical protein GCK72_008015 [Caenorhabditis remanei]